MYINIKGRGVSGGKSETNIWTGLFSPLISRSSHINSILLATNQHPSHFSDCLPKLHTTQYIIKKKAHMPKIPPKRNRQNTIAIPTNQHHITPTEKIKNKK